MRSRGAGRRSRPACAESEPKAGGFGRPEGSVELRWKFGTGAKTPLGPIRIPVEAAPPRMKNGGRWPASCYAAFASALGGAGEVTRWRAD